MKAVKIKENKTAAVVQDVATPQIRPGYVLVKTKAVGLNPTDWKHIDSGVGGVGSTLGCDLAGEVVEVGPGVTKDLKEGDRIICFTHGSNNLNHEDGSFGEYAVCRGDIAMRIPEGWDYEDAATLPVAVITCGQNLYQKLGIAWPGQDSGKVAPLLVYGASGSTGMAAVQLAKLSGYDVFATCSPHNFELVRSLGADRVYDYKDADCAARIREDSGNKLFLAMDCISTKPSMEICLNALSSDSQSPDGKSPKLGIILPHREVPRKDVELFFTLGYTLPGDPINKVTVKPDRDNTEDFEFGKRWCKTVEVLMAGGNLKPLPREVRPGGLDGILEALVDLKAGRNSGVKYVLSVP